MKILNLSFRSLKPLSMTSTPNKAFFVIHPSCHKILMEGTRRVDECAEEVHGSIQSNHIRKEEVMETYAPCIEGGNNDEFLFGWVNEYDMNLDIFGQQREGSDRMFTKEPGNMGIKSFDMGKDMTLEESRLIFDEGTIRPSEVFLDINKRGEGDRQDTREKKGGFKFKFITSASRRRDERNATEDLLRTYMEEKQEKTICSPKITDMESKPYGRASIFPNENMPGSEMCGISNFGTSFTSSNFSHGSKPRPDTQIPGRLEIPENFSVPKCMGFQGNGFVGYGQGAGERFPGYGYPFPPCRNPQASSMAFRTNNSTLLHDTLHRPIQRLPSSYMYPSQSPEFMFPRRIPLLPTSGSHNELYPFRSVDTSYMTAAGISLGFNGSSYQRMDKIILKVDRKALYKSRWMKRSSMSFRPTNSEILNNFYRVLNEFNKIVNLPFVHYKHADRLKLLFKELQPLGVFGADRKIWSRIRVYIPDLVFYKELYLFLVYPLEQYFFGKEIIRIYHGKNVDSFLLSALEKLEGYDISTCLIKGTMSDILYMFENLRIGHVINDDTIKPIIDLFFDVEEIIFQRIVRKDRCRQEYSVTFGMLKVLEFSNEEMIFMRNTCLDLISRYGIVCKKTSRNNKISMETMRRLVRTLYLENGEAKILMKHGDVSPPPLISIMLIVIHNPAEYKLDSWLYNTILKVLRVNPFLALKCITRVVSSKKKKKKFYRKLWKQIHPYLVFCIELMKKKVLLDDDGFIEAFVTVFKGIRPLKALIETIFFDILEYLCYVYEQKIYFVKKSSSDLFNVCMALRDIVKGPGVQDAHRANLLSRCMEMSCLREILF